MTMARRETALKRPAERGVSLIELMVSLVIGLFLIGGAITIYMNSRTAYRTLEATARVQEAARFAMGVIEADVRMANYWGLHNRFDYIVNRAANLDPATDDDPPTDLAIAETVIDACEDNFLVDVQRYVDGINGGYFASATSGCDPSPSGVNAAAVSALGSDLLIVRRASAATQAAPSLTRLQVQSSRLQGTLMPLSGQLAGALPAGYAAATSETRDLLVHAYYVSPRSVGDAAVPALRRKRLNAGSPISIGDDEIMPGVEDLQFELGIDESVPQDGIADRWEAPGGLDPNTDVVAAVRIWLRIRAETPEVGFTDNETYQYAGVTWTPSGNASSYRRMLISKTIHLRNSRR